MEEKDLGVVITADLKSSRQCMAAAAKARSVLGLINRHFRNLNGAQFLTLYKTCPSSSRILYPGTVSMAS
jgi:hypothetical protein